jgi:hypothetical protein
MSSQYDWEGEASVYAMTGRVSVRVDPRSKYREEQSVDITPTAARELAAALLAAADEAERSER